MCVVSYILFCSIIHLYCIAKWVNKLKQMLPISNDYSTVIRRNGFVHVVHNKTVSDIYKSLPLV